ncbi:oxygen-regulated protein 1-like protein [Lates japonicus]|uniref:Oxygen-regulated protein 1-like protein n=1 Tax=Lates japonicus TaxID=270547 RepID=A0AAD3MIM5_LATJO|nr:oxygen-regulated protein 1-like protein [Lates japonicus]
MLHKPKQQKRPSPYSQSLDMVSPPVGRKSSRKMLSRNLSSDNASEPANKTQRKTSSLRKRHQTSQSIKSTAEADKTLTCETLVLEAGQIDEDKEKSMTETQLMPQPLNIPNQPNMKPVLEKICYSIKSIRQITQNKRPSCLEKSNSLPDFSSHVASTFGSSSKALLAFLSVMTLKEGLTNFNMDELNANNVSCAEALKMIDCLREIASIEDSHTLKASLSNLQQSASKQLLQSWRGFQELSDKCKSRSSTPNYSEHELMTEAGLEKSLIEENVIDEIMVNFNIPEKLKEELACLSVKVKTESDSEEKMAARLIKKDNSYSKISHSPTEDDVTVRDVIQDEKANVDVTSMIKKFTNINQPKQSDMGSIPLITETVKQKPTDQETKDDEERQLYSTVIFVEEDTEEGRMEENQSEESMSISENELISDCESGSGEEGQNITSTNKDVEERESSKQSASHSEAGEQQPEVECEEIKQGRSEEDDFSNCDSHSEEEVDKQQSSNYYVELNMGGKESVPSPDSEKQSEEEEEPPEVKCKELSNKSEKEPEIQKSCVTDENAGNSDVDEPASSEEEQPEVECKNLKVINEESLSGNEEEKESIEEEEHLDDLPDHEEEMTKCKKLKALIEEAEEDKVNSDDEDPCLIKSDSLTKPYGLNADEDSGNDHSSCEEQIEVKIEQISSSIEEDLSYYEKESSSEEEHAKMDRYVRESCKAKQVVVTKAVEEVKHQAEEIISQSVAERISLLEKKVAEAQKRKNVPESPAVRRFSQKNVHLESDVEDSPSDSPTSQSALCTRSAPQSSLSFSYDSSGVITTEPEGNRVRSIREMFLAKSATDIQPGPRRFSNSSELSDLRAQTSASGGYQTQTSSEVSSGEDDSARKSITKGFVRRTIERLYGKKEVTADEEGSERPPSASKQKKKEHSSIFSPFHIVRSKAMSELSYFNSTNAMDTLSEATRCIAFNAQVGPGDSVPIDNGRWLIRENTVIRKSVSDPVSINKALTNPPVGEGMCEDTEQNTPYSLFSTKSEQEDNTKSFSRKCTYFSLPHASDSDACQDDLSTASKGSANGGDSITDTKDNPEDAKTWAERNGTLPAGGVTDFKMKDNKVHPMVEVPPDGEVVVVQPGKGQGVMNRRLPEPDMLDFLYNFCGEHCPIL